MEIIYEVAGHTLVAELFGEMDHHGAERIRTGIDEMMKNYSAKHLIFDFSKVTFMDSAGIGVILGRYRKLQLTGGNVAVVSCSPKIRNILNMAGIFSIMEYAETKADAVEILKGKEVS